MDKTSSDLVAIKKVRFTMNPALVENESKMLKECKSKYIVSYFDVIKRESEFWVCVHGLCHR